MAEDLTVDRHDDGIAVLTLARAPVNAMNPDFLGAIDRALEALGADPGVRGVVVASALKVYSAGLDLREMQGYGQSEQAAIVDALNQTFRDLYGFAKPIVAAVNGAAIAGGMFLPLTADHTVAVANAKFGLSEVQVGANFPAAPMEIARAELLPSGLRTLMLSGRPVEADRALHFGVVDEIVPDAKLMEKAIGVARDLATAPPNTYAAVKAQLRAPALQAIDQAIRERSDPTRTGWFTDETKAAMAAALTR